jgi:hypothetical protein
VFGDSSFLIRLLSGLSWFADEKLLDSRGICLVTGLVQITIKPIPHQQAAPPSTLCNFTSFSGKYIMKKSYFIDNYVEFHAIYFSIAIPTFF